MNKPRLFLLISIVVGLMALGLSIRFYGWEHTFSFWNIRDNHLPFLDLRLITGGAESYARGYDPATYDPGDPLGRIFNYPKIWYLVLSSGMDESWTLPIGIVIFALFLASISLFPGRLTALSAILMLFALVSPVVMLAIARMNVDMFIFSLMSLSLLLAQDYTTAAFAIFLMAVLLKIIPVLGVGGFLDRERGTSLKWISGALLFTSLYFVFTLKDMIFIFNSTQKGFDESYGVAVLPSLLRQLVHNATIREGPMFLYGALNRLYEFFLRYPRAPYVAAALIFLFLGYLGLRHGKPSGGGDLRNLRAFWMGAGMYIGTFLIGQNWDYRMIFLLLTLPQLSDWVNQEHRGLKLIALFGCVVLFWSLWSLVIQAFMTAANSFGVYAASLLDEVANWALFAALIYLFAFSLPGWILNDLRALSWRFPPHRGPTATAE